MQNNSHDKSSSKIIGAVAIVLVLIGVSIYATRGKDSGNTTAVSKIESVTPNKQIAPDFLLEKLGGGTISLAEYKGRKPVVLGFWTTWCPNCKRNMPDMNVFYEKYKDQVEVIGVNMQENPSLVQKTITNWGITFPIALDSSGSTTRAYGVRYTNVHVLIDKDGNVVRLIPGDIREADILELLK